MPAQVDTDYGEPVTWLQVQKLSRAARGVIGAACTIELCALGVNDSDFVSRTYLTEKGGAFALKAKALLSALRDMGVEVE